MEVWKTTAGHLACLPRRKVPGSLSFRDLVRLSVDLTKHDKELVKMEAELYEYAPLLAKRSLATKLVGVAEQARNVVDFSVMLREVLETYGDPGSVVGALGLDRDWLAKAQEKHREMDVRLQEVVGLALASL